MIQRSILFLALLLSLRAHAQEVRVVDGRKFTVHRVQAGETLYAISRHHAVDVHDLLKDNPAASQGLSIGQVLLIPQDAVDRRAKKKAPALFAGELAHTVARKETLYGIARNYGVDQQDLLARNPELQLGVKEGMIVIIPVSKVTTATAIEKLPAADDGSEMHLVMPGETLFALGKRYGVDPARIQEANGGLAQGLKAGTYVRIPRGSDAPAPRPIAADSLSRRERYEVAYLLPFSIAENDSVMRDPGAKEYYAYTSIALQFWSGAQLAIDSMKASGLNADVHVFDTGTDADTWSPVLRRGTMRDMDLFIGPFHRAAIEELARSNRDAHIVCPVPQSNKVLLGHPGVSKVMSSRNEQVRHLARYAALRHARDNIVLCEPPVPAEKDLQGQMHRALQEALDAQPVRMRDSVLVARPGRGGAADLAQRLDRTRLNVVILPSEDVETVVSVVRSLMPLTKDHRIVLFGLASWAEMSTLELNDLAALDLHLPSSTFIDRSDPRVIGFIRRFRERFHTEPDEYAFLGFDVSFFYLSALRGVGRDLSGRFELVRTQPLHMGFRMQQAGIENGFRNESTFILHYAGLELKKAE